MVGFKATFRLGYQPRLKGGFTTPLGLKGKWYDREIKCHEFSVRSVSLTVSPTDLYCEAEVSLITGKYSEKNIYGPASSLKDKSLIYPCKHFKCHLSCPCYRCRKNSNRCPNSDHDILAGGGCSECQDDYWEHILFHLVEHTSCKFCKEMFKLLPLKKSQVSETQGFYPDFFTVMIPSFFVIHIPAYVKYERIDSNPEFPCDKCDKSFQADGNLRRHEKEKHFGAVNKECSLCGKQFIRKTQLERHMKTTHVDCDDGLQQFQCEHCSKHFQDKFSLERHARSSQTCDVCALTLCTLRHLSAHKKKAHCAFSCDRCNKSFRDGEKLKKHQNFMNCEICDQQFCNGQELKKHMGLHKGTFKCNFCEKDLASKRRMEEHMQRRTENPCPICKKVFCYAADLNSHKISCHMN